MRRSAFYFTTFTVLLAAACADGPGATDDAPPAQGGKGDGLFPLCAAAGDLGSATGRVAIDVVDPESPSVVDSTCNPFALPADTYAWSAPATGPFLFMLIGSPDTSLFIRDADADTLLCGEELACTSSVNDLSVVHVEAGQRLHVSVVGSRFAPSTYDLFIAPDQPINLELCANGLDDDGDGALDCGDSDCVGSPECDVIQLELCSNGLDDDGDGAFDCDDSDCVGSFECEVPLETCGPTVCEPGLICCNPLAGICTAPDEFCIQ